MCECQSDAQGSTNGEQILRRAIEEARRDSYGGKVLLTLEQAEKIHQAIVGGSEFMRRPAQAPFSKDSVPRKGFGST